MTAITQTFHQRKRLNFGSAERAFETEAGEEDAHVVSVALQFFN